MGVGLDEIQTELADLDIEVVHIAWCTNHGKNSFHIHSKLSTVGKRTLLVDLDFWCEGD